MQMISKSFIWQPLIQAPLKLNQEALLVIMLTINICLLNNRVGMVV